MWSTLNLAPRRKSSRWSWEPLACASGLASGLADWPLAAHSALAPAPAATPASAAACFRNRLRPDELDSMIALRDADLSWGWPACLRQPLCPYFLVKSVACQPGASTRHRGHRHRH